MNSDSNTCVSDPCYLTTLQPYNLTTLQPYNLTPLHLYTFTPLHLYTLTLLHPYSLTPSVQKYKRQTDKKTKRKKEKRQKDNKSKKATKTKKQNNKTIIYREIFNHEVLKFWLISHETCTIRYCDFGKISHHICNHEIL